jgi:hypothetical protein
MYLVEVGHHWGRGCQMLCPNRRRPLWQFCSALQHYWANMSGDFKTQLCDVAVSDVEPPRLLDT